MNLSKNNLWTLFIIATMLMFNINLSMGQYNALTIDEHRSFLNTVQVSDGSMSYIDVGQGPVIMLVHGIPTSSWLYRHMIPKLVAKGYRVIAPDLLGYGGSDKPENMDLYHPKLQAKRLLELMLHLKIDQWHQLCHDAGGVWTWEMLMQNSEALKSLVVLNTILFSEGFDPPLTFKENSFWGRKYSKMYCSKTFGKGMMNATLKNGLCVNELTKDDKKGYWLPMREGGHKAINHFFTNFNYTKSQLPSYQEALKSSQIPVSVIWGKQDKILIAAKQLPLIKNLLPLDDSDIHVLDNAKHFIQEEEPDKIVELVDEFLRK